MHKVLNYFRVNVVLILSGLAVFAIACEGPQGPPGEQGVPGIVTCGQCHGVSTDVKARIIQYEASKHYNGGTFERASAECAACHTHEGFVQRMESGKMAADEDIDNPTPPNCRTCHNIHETYTYEDFKLTVQEPVEFWINGEKLNIGSGNVCAQCHQPRVPDPMPELGGGEVQINSPYWGPHHGTQGTILAGTGGIEFAGSVEYKNTPHKSALKNGCVGCHMQDEAYGDQAGGHTMKVHFHYHGREADHTDVCTRCHTDLESFDYNGVQTEIETLVTDLQEKLMNAGILDEEDHAVPGTYSAEQAGALFNYLLVVEDRSDGIHNYKYTKALLQNTIETLN